MTAQTGCILLAHKLWMSSRNGAGNEPGMVPVGNEPGSAACQDWKQLEKDNSTEVIYTRIPT